ncbi:MAG: C-methyltransferase [Parcubacteria group bacterium Gr01-1014_70]|nr:MAG: C-methyltransferase [Parcubacteria group bacterium Gr01-1014_70]
MHTYPICRICGNTKLYFSGHLGNLPQINYCSKSAEEAKHLKKIPINLFFCEHCYHFQLGESFSPEETFKTYSYATQFTPSIRKHGNTIVDWFTEKYGMQKNAFVVELASSDGAILRSFVDRGYTRVLGIEPAANIARIARKNGIKTEAKFFSRAFAASVVRRHGKADFVLARNVLAHVPETVDFLQGIRDLLKPEGVFCVETPYGKNLIDFFEFDSIYHEHLSYYLVSTLQYAFGRAGLAIINIEETNMHTGSLAVFAKRVEAKHPVSPHVAEYMQEERKNGYFEKQLYKNFIAKCKLRIANIQPYVSRIRKQESVLVGYGAAAKANVIINLAGITPETINFIVDRNPLKHHTWAPGSGIPIKPVAQLAASPAKHIILFAWNFADQILQANKDLSRAGKQFHVLIPKPMRITPELLQKKNSFKFYRSLDV